MNQAEQYFPVPPPPRGADLPTEDGIPMETQLHRLIMSLLIETLETAWAGRSDFYVGGNMFFYFSALQSKKNDFRGPDFFVVLETEHRARESWVTWEENGQGPSFVLEITSRSTEEIDRGEKKRIYEKVLRIPEYFIYDPRSGELEGYRLFPGQRYEPIPRTTEGRFASEQLGLWLGTEVCSFLGYRDRFVRFYAPDGTRLPSQEERAAQMEERLRAYEQRFGALP